MATIFLINHLLAAKWKKLKKNQGLQSIRFLSQSPPKQKKNVKENDSENGKTQTRLYWP